LNLLDEVEHFSDDRNHHLAPHAATEMNFGLHFAGSGRLARQGRLGQGSMYLWTAIDTRRDRASDHFRSTTTSSYHCMRSLRCAPQTLPTFNVQRSTFQPSTFPTFNAQRSTFQRPTFNVPTLNV